MLQNTKPLKIKHLLKFFAVLQSTAKTAPNRPPHPLARFLHALSPFFLYIAVALQKLQKQKQKINQIIGVVRFAVFAASFAVPLQWLCSFLTASENHDITKHHPAPPLDPPLARKLNNALHFSNR